MYGLASVAGGVNPHVAPVAAAWGIAFVVTMLPAPYLRARRSKRLSDAEARQIRNPKHDLLSRRSRTIRNKDRNPKKKMQNGSNPSSF